MSVVPIKSHKAFVREERQSAARTLSNSKARKPSQVLVVGVDEGGDLFVSGYPNDPGNALWLMERAKLALLGASA